MVVSEQDRKFHARFHGSKRILREEFILAGPKEAGC
jgi:hypothetical protein